MLGSLYLFYDARNLFQEGQEAFARALRLAELSTLLQSMRNNVQAVNAECDRLLRGFDGRDIDDAVLRLRDDLLCDHQYIVIRRRKPGRRK